MLLWLRLLLDATTLYTTMNTRYLITALAAALMSAGQTLQEYAENTPSVDNDTGEIEPEVVLQAQSDTIELDASGLPWHSAIHSGNKTKKADGTWIKRKGVDDITFNKVTAELRLTFPVAGAAAPSPAPAPLAPPASGPKLPKSLKPPVIVKTPYTELTEWIAAHIADKSVTQEWVNDAFAGWEVSMAALAEDGETATSCLNLFKEALGEA